MLNSNWEGAPDRHAFLVNISPLWSSTKDGLLEYDLSPRGIPSSKLLDLTGGIIQLGFDRLEHYNSENWSSGGYWNNEDVTKYITLEDKEYLVDEVVRFIKVQACTGANVTSLSHLWTFKSLSMDRVLICVDDRDYDARS